MCSIYDEEVNVNLAFNTITKIIMVIKQMEESRQTPLLVAVRRLIDITTPTMDKESATKMLTLIASVKSFTSKSVLGELIPNLVAKIGLDQLTPQIPKTS